MKALSLALLSWTFLGAVRARSAAKGTGSSTRGWTCCKNSCSWSNKALVDSPVISCDAQDNLGISPARRDGCESGGGSFGCSDLSPWATSNELAYGFAGVNFANVNESATCCSCYSLTFTSAPVNGKKMIVQIVTSALDLGDEQFDIAIPGGGQGSIGGCTKQFGRSDIWGATYGGISHRDECNALPDPLKAGCYWRFDWFRNADNPNVNWEQITCPEQLSYISGCRRNDDPISGKSTSTPTPTPTPTKSAPVSSGTVQPGGQCGGRNYRGPTVCVGGTVCTFFDEETYYCLVDPASTRTTPKTTTPTAAPTIALPWDQCGGRGYAGPTKCKDSECKSLDEWYWQCQPTSGYTPPTSSAPPAVSSKSLTSTPGAPAWPGWPVWSFTRPHRTWPGEQPPLQASTTRPAQPGSPTTPTKPSTPTPTIAQLFEQCAGLTWFGPTRCAQGLSCVYVDDYYSQCRKPSKKRSLKVRI
ncbi:hypothetical protein CC78DRAFT_606478 [Lojkania enalia]|uniref:cellulase n=1 Tax=Lojkania enalia TaxID=147567 RepID=A0A9P4N4N8_9PLEO|nr:hypothetical protein CC78DRAFT_606478 [Didymosphaeria enalia]